MLERIETLIAVAVLASCPCFCAAKENSSTPSTPIWRIPADIESRDLFYGAGGQKHQPRGPFRFIEEDKDGTNPKFTIEDQDGVRWKVKLGEEVRSETAASRLLWGVGYFTDEDYFIQGPGCRRPGRLLDREAHPTRRRKDRRAAGPARADRRVEAPIGAFSEPKLLLPIS